MKVYFPLEATLRVCRCPAEFPVGYYWYGGRRIGPGRPPKWVDKLMTRSELSVSQGQTAQETDHETDWEDDREDSQGVGNDIPNDEEGRVDKDSVLGNPLQAPVPTRQSARSRSAPDYLA